MDFLGAKAYIQTRLRDELSESLYYHGYHHTVDVSLATTKFAEAEGITDEEGMLLEIAAWFHDSGFLTTYTDHEAAGIALAQEALPKFGFTEAQIQQIADMIIATKIPQSPKNHLEQILCDADLAYLGGPTYYPVAETLRKELSSRNLLSDPQQWLEMQVKFLQTHQYFTQTAKQLCDQQKAERLSELQQQLETSKIDG